MRQLFAGCLNATLADYQKELQGQLLIKLHEEHEVWYLYCDLMHNL